MKKLFALISLVFLLLVTSFASAQSRYDRSYQIYFDLAKKAYLAGEYNDAILYLETAYAIDPTQEKLLEYIERIKKVQAGKTRPRTRPIHSARNFQKNNLKPSSPRDSSVPPKAVVSRQLTPRPQAMPTEAPVKTSAGFMDLGHPLWQRQPNMPLVMEMRKFLVLRGSNIQRYLIITQGFIHIERIDKDQIKIYADQVGKTFFHVWDDTGRWTFNLTVILPISETISIKREEIKPFVDEQEDPFKFDYSNTLSSYYRGSNVPNLRRQNLNFQQYFGLSGKTPYGDAYATATYYKFEETTERIGESLGLTNGNIGPFKDFNIRGQDTYVQFSDLSLPGRNFRGGLLDAYAFDHKLKYTVFQGQDRASFLFITPGLFNIQKSYLEGGKITLFPDDPHSYSFNYAHGYGEAREKYLPSNVYSVETQHKFTDFKSYAELGYDTNIYSGNFNNTLEKGDHALRLNFRDIEKDYYAITGRPAAQGEIGTNVIWDWKPSLLNLYSNVDLYRDRLSPNREHPKKVNLNLSSSADILIDDTSRVGTSVYYINSPQQLSPTQDFRIDSRYSKNLRIFGDRDVSAYVGANYQVNRTPDNASTEYDRYGLSSGFRFYILPQLSYYTSYEYYWVKELFNSRHYQPQAFENGLYYSRLFFKYFNTQIGAAYRKEIDSDNNFSFLSGQDSLRGNFDITCNPYRDVQIYLDGQLQNIFPANPNSDAFVDANIIMGVRSSWDLPFSWSPAGEISGSVYKDLNGNSVRDAKEVGLEGVIIKVGRQEVMTDQEGNYHAHVRAKRVRVAIDVDSLPKGFVFATALNRDVSIAKDAKITVNFGVTSRTMIYGIVFHDANGNGKIDPQEELVPNVTMLLDHVTMARTDAQGSYTFENVLPQKHTMIIDINSLPLKYIPRIKIEKQIDVAEGATYVYHVPLRENR